MVLPAITARTTRVIARLAEKLSLPLAVLSVAVFWYCWIMDGVAWDLASLYMRAVISRQKKGYARRSPVPD